MSYVNPFNSKSSTTVEEPRKAKIASEAAAYGSLALVSTHNGDELAGQDDSEYEFNHLKPSFPKVNWPPLEEFDHVDVGLSAPSLGKSKKENLILKKASGHKFLTPALGIELRGLDLPSLTDEEKNDFALLAAQVGVVVVRGQKDLTVDQQLNFGRYFGRLHKHATTAVPKSGDLDEIHLVYADKNSRPDNTVFKKVELYHSDVTYELQPPGLTSLRLVAQPEVGGDTIFSSGLAAYSSFSKGFQAYLETLFAVHSGVAQAKGSEAAGNHVRRDPVETIHPIVRVHPVTGQKSIFVNPGFTRRIVGVPKSESDAILGLLYDTFVSSADHQVRASWEEGTVVFWDNRLVNHSALFDFFPARRHGVRVTPHGERPLSVAQYEEKYNAKAKDWAEERAKELGVDVSQKKDVGGVKERGFKD
ncbi:Taurine catabolism dioxygenase TauD/TfdA [Phaffia rhodozyma]|uniref:Taurine catabolism dioxygenase TauD/TfdA n=1 Tax=Phaffia rhodozyma TaxID=264483 RepID=A0A0F7SNJ9_PHARH|nr:Taurine catabolism dioxygenase TauD/TfdA [Phaffia rhodozyma]